MLPNAIRVSSMTTKHRIRRPDVAERDPRVVEVPFGDTAGVPSSFVVATAPALKVAMSFFIGPVSLFIIRLR